MVLIMKDTMYTVEEVEFMIRDYCEDLDFVIYKDIINLFSKHLNYDLMRIMKKGKSTMIHGVIGKIDGKEVSRITNLNQTKKILEKTVKIIEKDSGKMNIEDKHYVVETLINKLEKKVANS